MATYDFLCPECEHTQDVRATISEAEKIHPPCGKCGAPTSKTFIASNFRGQFCLRGEWDGKLDRETKYRERRSKELAKKQKDNHHIPRLQPNVNGEQVASWSDAKKLAKDKGYDTTHYEDKVKSLSKGNA